MPGKPPIDYARAESDVVVRKKFRRRVVMFVIATVVVTVISGGWRLSWSNPLLQKLTRENFFDPPPPRRVESFDGWIVLRGPYRERSQVGNGIATGNGVKREIQRIEIFGILWSRWDSPGAPKFFLWVRYRTLFILAIIPWIITLIRLIRMWKRKRLFETEPRTQ